MQPVRGELAPTLLAGRLPSSAGEIVLGRVATRDLDAGIEDEVVVDGGDGPVAFRVSGLALIPSVEGGDGIGEGGVEGLRRLDPGAALGVSAIRLRPGARGAAGRLADTLGVPVGPPDPPPTVLNVQRARSTPFIVAASLAALLVLSMAHQLLVSARRRGRDLALLRALGADRALVSGILHWQATLLVAAVAAVALPLGIAAGRLAYWGYIDRIGAATDLSVPYGLLAATVVGFLVLGNVTAVLPARRNRAQLPARVLAAE